MKPSGPGVFSFVRLLSIDSTSLIERGKLRLPSYGGLVFEGIDTLCVIYQIDRTFYSISLL